MQQSYSSFATAPAVNHRPVFDGLWEKAVNHGVFLLYLSLLILLFSTIDNGPLGDLVKCCWLISFSALALVNIGSAFVAYIASLALYSPLHYESMFPLLQRPDNLAMPILFAAMAFQVLSRNRHLRSVNPYVAVLIFYFLVHGLIFAPEHSAALIRNIIPFLACLLAAWIGFGQQEIKAFEDGLIALGWYSGFVSILERTPFVDRVLPFWIGDPSLRPFDLYQDQWLDLHRSGGPLLQPAFNGLAPRNGPADHCSSFAERYNPIPCIRSFLLPGGHIIHLHTRSNALYTPGPVMVSRMARNQEASKEAAAHASGRCSARPCGRPCRRR